MSDNHTTKMSNNSLDLFNGHSDSDLPQVTEQKIPVFEDDGQPSYDDIDDANEDYSYPNDEDDFLRRLANADSQDEGNNADQHLGAQPSGTGASEADLPVLYYDEEVEQFCEYFVSTRLARYWNSAAGKYVSWFWEPEDLPESLRSVLQAYADIDAGAAALYNGGGALEHEKVESEMGVAADLGIGQEEDEDVGDKEIRLLF